MHILYLTQVLPFPRDAGPKVRAYYVLRHLAQAHEITLVSFVRSSDTPAAVAHLEGFCTHVYTVPMPRAAWRDGLHLARSLAGPVPFLIARDWVPAMAAKLTELVANGSPVDAVHADQLWMAPYALAAQAASRPTRPFTVLDQHNAVYKIPERMREGTHNPLKRAVLDLEARKLARYELDTCRRFDHVVWVTEEDRAALPAADAHAAADSAPTVIPICIDPAASPAIVRKPDARRVTFLGGLHYPPNAAGIVWFAREVFPRILAAAPDAVLTVLGKQPPQELQQLGIPAANLEITGYVDDPHPYLAETAAFIVPLHAGGGMRVKILEAWAWGLPMVSTTVGAEGIQTRPGQNILIADTPEEFAGQTVSLLRDPARGRQIGEAGRRWVEQHYAWQTVYPQWDHIYAPQRVRQFA